MKKDVYDLSNPQKSIWYTEEFFKGTGINNICGSSRIDEVVDFNRLEKALNLFLKSNENFNLKITLEDGIPKQYVSEFSELKFEMLNLKNYDEVLKKQKEMVR